MARYELKLPHMGESVAEATITSWLKQVGETIEAEDIIVEVATDKVDSEIPCEVSGVITQILFETDQVVQVGQVMAIIETQEEGTENEQKISEEVTKTTETETVKKEFITEPTPVIEQKMISEAVQHIEKSIENIVNNPITSTEDRFYSPLVKTIAREENISMEELGQIEGSGLDGRVTKYDILAYLEKRNPSLIISNSVQNVGDKPTSEEISVSSVQETTLKETPDTEVSTINQITENESVIEELKDFTQIPQTEVSSFVLQGKDSPSEDQLKEEVSVSEEKVSIPVQEVENEVIEEVLVPEEKISIPSQEVENEVIEETLTEANFVTQQPTVAEVEEETIVVENQILTDNGSTKKEEITSEKETAAPVLVSNSEQKAEQTVSSDDVEIIPMTRMGKLISKYMVESKRISPHVQSFTEVDVTRIWNWRNKIKDKFEKQEGQKFTFTPIFIEAVAQALRDFPMMNVSTDGEQIFKKKHINIGMATALPNGDLIVPVIKKADTLSLVGLAKTVNDLAQRARQNKLKPDDITGGTYTVTNIGSFGNVFGTPIINQPEVGILAIGAIQKVPAVIETPEGDMIGIRYKMMLSHSYDHRVVNGALGGMFVQRVAQYLEKWNMDREI